MSALLGDLSLRVIVDWPNGSRLPVRVSRYATGEDLINLLRFSFTPDAVCVLMYKGAYVNPTYALSRQMKSNDVVAIRRVPRDLLVVDSDWSSDSEDAEIDEFSRVYGEVLRLADVQFNLFEVHRRGALMLRSCLKEQSESDDNDTEPVATVFGEKLTEIPSDPLPKLTVEDEAIDMRRDRIMAVRGWHW